MADVTALVAYEGAMGEDGTVSVSGPGRCTVSLSGDFGGGTVTLNQRINGAWVPLTNDGTDVTATADNDWTFEFPAESFHEVQASLASSSSPDLNVAIKFAAEPPLQ